MNNNNEKLPWILILGGGIVLVIRLIVALFSSLNMLRISLLAQERLKLFCSITEGMIFIVLNT